MLLNTDSVVNRFILIINWHKQVPIVSQCQEQGHLITCGTPPRLDKVDWPINNEMMHVMILICKWTNEISTDTLLTSTDYFLTPTDFYHTSYCHFDRLYTGGGFPRDRRIPYHMPGLMDALRTFGVPFSFYSWLLMLNPGQKFKNRKDNWDPQVGYKRQGDRGKRAPEEEMGLIFPPANIHGTTIECKSIILSKECFISCCR